MFRPASLTVLITLLCSGTALAQIPTQKIGCIQCSTRDNPNCINADIEPSSCSRDKWCYTRLVDGHVQRGCGDQMILQDLLRCAQGTLPNCVACIGFGCNNVFWPRCHQCSEAGDAGCADEQDDLDATICRYSSTNNYCYVELNNGRVSRGCGSDYPECLQNGVSCHICSKDSCNGLAKTDLKSTKCQECHSSNNDCADGSSIGLNTECSRLADSCFTTIKDNKVQRGCLDSIGSNECTTAADASCVVCQGDNCNQNPWLTCYQCEVQETDLPIIPFNDCKKEQSAVSTPKFCKNQQVGDKCYTRTSAGYFERGCLSDLPPNSSVDKQCSEPGCNSWSSVRRLSINMVILAIGLITVVLL